MCRFIPATSLKKRKEKKNPAHRRVIPGVESPRRGCHGSLVNSPLVFPPSSDGLAAFRAFLRTEFSEENLEFWLACEEYKKIKSQSKMASKAKKIFAEYIAIQSCKEVRGNFPPPKKGLAAAAWFPPHGSLVPVVCLHR